MYTQGKRYDVVLQEKYKVRIEMFMLRQEAPWLKDDVTIYVRIMLPAQEHGLVEGLRFANRLKVAGESLHEDWGADLVEGHRSKGICVRASRASRAWSKAEAWAWGEIKKLDSALEKRARARET